MKFNKISWDLFLSSAGFIVFLSFYIFNPSSLLSPYAIMEIFAVTFFLALDSGSVWFQTAKLFLSGALILLNIFPVVVVMMGSTDYLYTYLRTVGLFLTGITMLKPVLSWFKVRRSIIFSILTILVVLFIIGLTHPITLLID